MDEIIDVVVDVVGEIIDAIVSRVKPRKKRKGGEKNKIAQVDVPEKDRDGE